MPLLSLSTKKKHTTYTEEAEKEASQLGWATFLFGLFSLAFISFLIPGTSSKPSTITSGPFISVAIDTGDTAWMLASSGLVLLMTPGLAFFYGGMVNSRNLVSTIFQSFAATGVVTILWLVVGFSLSFGRTFNGLIGDPFDFFFFQNVSLHPHPSVANTVPFLLFALFQMKFAIIAPALITGALAERIKFTALLLYMGCWSLLVYTPFAHWTWNENGIFHTWGIIDFAGGTVVHVSAGVAALAAALYVGPRHSRVQNHPEVPSNIPFVVLGTGLLWFGWFGFNAGSAFKADGIATIAFLNTMVSSATGLLTWLALDGIKGKKPSAVGACLGAVVGLVAITPSAGFVSTSASIPIGFFTVCVSNYLVTLRHKFPFDDALDVFACHGVGGIIGMILAAVFAEEGGLLTGETNLFIAHTLGLLISVIYAFGVSYVLCYIIDFIIPMRVSREEEESGLDRTQHGEVAMGYSHGYTIIEEISQHLMDIDYRRPRSASETSFVKREQDASTSQEPTSSSIDSTNL